jgi:AraC family transcriptional activator of pobA
MTPPTQRPANPAPDRPPPLRQPRRLPAFALYGEAGGPAPALLHIESIDSRSRLHDWEIAAHVHAGLHQVLWLQAGRAEAVLDESRSACEGPVALVVPPGVAHAFRFSPHADGFVLTLNAARLAEGDAAAAGRALAELFAAPRRLPLDAAAPEALRLQRLFEALAAEQMGDYWPGGDGANPVPVWLARAIIWRLAQLAQRGGPGGAAGGADAGQGGVEAGDARASGPVGQVGTAKGTARSALYTRWVVLVEANYRAHWPVSRYAGQLGLSTERLNRLVRAETGMNAQRVLHERLLREACRWLVHVAAPVSALAFELGFDDPAYFSRFFRRHTGLSPRAYRQRHQPGTAHG